VLERGYTITRDGDDRVVKRVTDASLGATLVTEFADGRATSRVEAVTEDGDG
jgi:exonuclease VII large subunit